jgi:uncharacterized protein YndB with AHSA1/START domain
MADILLDFPIRALPARVFEAVSTPAGLDRWWTKRSAGEALTGRKYKLWFGPDHDWRAEVTRCVPVSEFELQLVRADDDWVGTRVGFQLEARDASTWVRFRHTGWPERNEHYRISCNCWAMYLRVLRRYLEHGETVPYEARLDV